MAGITLKNITKTYENNVTVIPGMNLEIRDKEFIILVGPSGCGKSTTLRMIAGLEDVSSGEIYIGNRLVNDVPPKDRNIAMVFQSYALYPHMTVYKNMAFALQLKKVPKEEIDRKVRQVAKILELEPYLNRKPKALSGGQRQRVALGRAMVRDPAVFLLDEPLSNLDAKLRTEMRSQISGLHQKLQTTFVYVTHDQTEAMTMADRIVVLKDGVVQQVDTPQELYDHPVNQFVAGFIGTPPMNFFASQVEKGERGHALRFGTCIISTGAAGLEPYEGRTINVGIRPEDIHGEEAFLALSTSGQLEAHVDLAEMMGAEIYLYITVEGHKLVSRVPSRMGVHSGDTIHLAVDGNKLHLFDPETQERI
ncbi:MAG: sn-glycerol-3-phosphate ABC transporter ATP-binding protein UgpC [Pseudoflavonifractor sp.]|nr:sn-glycerol-3-phosphate ABC transporter ATP-binding protein UgpC [Pseudoflavonifractor sp.]